MGNRLEITAQSPADATLADGFVTLRARFAQTCRASCCRG